MLLAVAPPASVNSAVGPAELAVALLPIFDVFADIFATILPTEDSLPMHFIISPITLVRSLIRPDIDSLAMNHVVKEFSNEAGIVRPLEGASSVLLGVLVTTFVGGAVLPGL